MRQLSFFMPLLALWLLPLTTNAAAKVTHLDTHGFIVENQVMVEDERSHAWSALVNDVDQWWPKSHSWWQGTFSIDAKAGGCFCEHQGDNSAEHMRVSFAQPYHKLLMTGGLGPLQGMGMFGALEWRFEEVEGGTLIVLTYRVSGIHPGGFAELSEIVARVQGAQLKALADYISK